MCSTFAFPTYWYATHRAKKQWEKDWQLQSYTYGEHTRQYYLVVENDALSAADPWVVYFHGGAWTFGTPEQFSPAARLFLAAGYRVVLPAYRRLPGIGFAGIWDDIQRLFTQLQQDRRFSSPPSIVAGMSAGGHLAASIAWRRSWWQARDWGQAPEKVLLLSAPLDLDQMHHPGLRLLRGAVNSAAYHESNPTYWLLQQHKLNSRHLLIHGTADRMVPSQQLQRPQEQLQKIIQPTNGLQVRLLPGGSHLDVCRWMYQEDELAAEIRAFISLD